MNTTGTTAQDALDAQVTELTTGLDTAYMLLSAFLVFLMQAGFAMLCAGSVRSKNVKNILIKNVLDACVGCMAFYFFGWGVAYGVDADGKGNEWSKSARRPSLGLGYRSHTEREHNDETYKAACIASGTPEWHPWRNGSWATLDGWVDPIRFM